MSTIAVKTVPIRRPPQADAGKGDYLARAVALHLAGKREEALKQLQRAIAANEASPEIYRAMGHIQFEMGEYKDAAKTYRLLTQIKPQYAMGWFNLAVSLERLSAWEEASKALRQSGRHSTRSTATRTWGWASATCGWKIRSPRSIRSSAAWNSRPTRKKRRSARPPRCKRWGTPTRPRRSTRASWRAIRTPRSRSPTWC